MKTSALTRMKRIIKKLKQWKDHHLDGLSAIFQIIPGMSTIPDAILRHISKNGYRRPAENVERRELELNELEQPLF